MKFLHLFYENVEDKEHGKELGPPMCTRDVCRKGFKREEKMVRATKLERTQR